MSETNKIDLEKDVGDNAEILKLLKERLELGYKRYGHGVKVSADTREWGTKENSWEEMLIEETLDAMIYGTAAILRLRRERKKNLAKDK